MGDYDQRFFGNNNQINSTNSVANRQEPPQQSRPNYRSVRDLETPKGDDYVKRAREEKLVETHAQSAHTANARSTSPHHFDSEMGKDRWNPKSDSSWNRVNGTTTQGTNTKVTTYFGQPVYQKQYGSTNVYGWRDSNGVANFADKKPPLKKEEPTPGYGDK